MTFFSLTFSLSETQSSKPKNKALLTHSQATSTPTSNLHVIVHLPDRFQPKNMQPRHLGEQIRRVCAAGHGTATVEVKTWRAVCHENGEVVPVSCRSRAGQSSMPSEGVYRSTEVP